MDRELLARKTLEIDEAPEEILPPWYLSAFNIHVDSHPSDTNFIVELGELGKPGTGGNGFGAATCMEDSCWKDILLGPDPDLPDGGKKRGLGSFWEYGVHCDTEEHKQGRDARLAKIKKPGPPSKPTTSLPSFTSSSSYQPQAGPSRLPVMPLPPSSPSSKPYAWSSSPMPKQPRSSFLDDLDNLHKPKPKSKPLTSTSTLLNQPSLSTSPNRDRKPLSTTYRPTPLHRRDVNIPPVKAEPSSPGRGGSFKDVKPGISASRGSQYEPIFLSDSEDEDLPASNLDNDSDDGVLELKDDEIPLDMRKTTNKSQPLILSDSDEDMPTAMPRRLKGTVGSSQGAVAPIFSSQASRLVPSPKRDVPTTTATAAPEVARQAPVVSAAIAAAASTLAPPTSGPVAPRPTIDATMRNRLITNEITQLSILLRTLPRNSMVEIQHYNDVLNRIRQLTTLRYGPAEAAYEPPFAGLVARHPELNRFSVIHNIHGRHLAANTSQEQIANAVAGPSTEPAQVDIKPIGLGGIGIPGYPPGWVMGPNGLPMPGIPGAYPGANDDMDEEARYHWEPPMRSDELQEFFTSALDDFAEDQDIEKALQKLGLNSAEDHFSDLTVRLMPHQLLGVSWMLDKEKDRKLRGGLLCDAMGLGKTVQTIATIVGNRSQDRKVKTTLVVAPLALLTQWKTEIESKTTAGLMKVHIYHGSNRIKSNAQLRQFDVVLTTYGTLVSEFGTEPKKVKKKKNRPPQSDDESSEEEYVAKKQGPLFKVGWYRVVLDESHNIRNRNIRASKAVCELNSILRWSLTGTLVNNSLDDIYAHIKFTGIGPYKDWSNFRKHITNVVKKKPKLATKRAQAILRTCMIRRHKESLLNGKRLLELPPKTTQIHELDFSPEEREIYNGVEKRMRIRFNHYLKAGTVLKHMSNILVMLMRLRQLCNHPWLLRRNPGDPAHPDDFSVDDADLFSNLDGPGCDPEVLAKAIEIMGQEWVDDLTQRLKARWERLALAIKKDEDDAERDDECAICLDMMADEAVVSCKHSFCRTCITEVFTNPPRDVDEITDDQAQRGARKCPLCRGIIEKEKVFAAKAFYDPEVKDKVTGDDEAEEGSDEDDYEPTDRKGKRRAIDEPDVKPKIKRPSLDGKGKGKGKASDEEEEVGNISDLENVLPSTKMKYLQDLLDEYLDEADAKIIIFSQFVTYIDLVSVYLNSNNVIHEKYVGSMKPKDREEAVRKFTSPIEDETSPRVMLISLKCGGVGLNLTAASKVICLDLAWNAATENQAVDRAHRIGQTKPVDVRRLIIKDSVEQRILTLQQNKEALADGAMGEGNGGRLGRLSVQDLIKLFGRDDE